MTTSTIKRYSRTPVLNGSVYGTSYVISFLRTAIRTNQLRYDTIIVHQKERLDTLAAQIYGDGKLWWVLAACSDIGFGLQVPAGTVVRVPNLEDTMKLIGE
jgi:uncharacterized lipoprotein YbaY